MTRAFIGLGSNRGDRAAHVRASLSLLSGLPRSRLTGISSLYDTDPVGDAAVPNYLNAVARLDTDLSPRELWLALAELERTQGRAATARRGPRTIDLDLLYYGDQVVREPDLRIPHPGIPDRPFVLVPMVELEPTWVDPELGLGLAGLLARRRRLASVRWVGRLQG